MISQETIDGLIDALSDLSEATNSIIHGGGEVPAEARVINSLNSLLPQTLFQQIWVEN